MVVLACLAGLPASAHATTGWSAPQKVGVQGGLGPSVDVDRSGTVRIFEGGERDPFEVVVVRRGRTKKVRCRVPGLTDKTPVGFSSWEVNDAGAMAIVWNQGSKGIRAATAAPGKCFGRPAPVGASRDRVYEGMRLSESGRVVVYWYEGEHALAYATGTIGGRLARRGVAIRTTDAGFVVQNPAFIRDDRIVWSWLTLERVADDDILERMWAATSEPRAGRVGRKLELASKVNVQPPPEDGPDSQRTLQGMDVVTDASGAQVAMRTDGGGLHVMTRKPGRPYGAPRTFGPSANATDWVSAAINRKGTMAIAWNAGDELYAMTRRGGTFSEPQLMSGEGHPRVADRPSAGVDASGRMALAWKSQSASAEQLAASEIRVAEAGRSGGFGPEVILSPQERGAYDLPQLDVASNGRAAVTWSQDHLDSIGNISSTSIFFSRGTLDG